MCSIAAAGLAVGALSAGTSYVGQRQQAKQQRRYQGQAAAAERQRAIQEQSALRMREAQQMEALHTELGDIALKSREALSTADVARGERNVGGRAASVVNDELIREWLNYSTRITRQQELQNINTELALTDAGFRTQMNQIGIGKPVPEPSWLSGGLGAVRGGVEGYRTGMQIKQMRNS